MAKDFAPFLCLALDNLKTPADVKALVTSTRACFGTFKVGMELFTRYGPSILDPVFESGKKAFLDLKYHDIPQTVANAVLSASRLGVQYITLHTHGGSTMMKAATEAALKAADQGLSPPKLIGVTLLTSIDATMLLNELNVSVALEQHIKILALRAIDALLDGIVCSAADLPHVKFLLPEGFEIITPGIRLSESPAHDQKRIATPKQAIANGATMLVIGRAVTDSQDPAQAAEKILKSLE
jgi:orotidine-5'-phosphate decarboxylase